MIVRKIFLGAVAVALTSSPAWVLPAVAPADQGASHSQADNSGSTDNSSGSAEDNSGSKNNNPGKDGANHGNGADHGNGANHGKSHKCAPHRVGYVAGGSLEAETLTENEDGTFSGELEVLVSHTNHHAKRDKGEVVTYTVENVHVTFGMEDTNNDGTVNLEDLAKGDWVHLIGRISVLAKKCPTGEFTQVMKIRHIVFHAPRSEAASEDQSSSEDSSSGEDQASSEDESSSTDTSSEAGS